MRIARCLIVAALLWGMTMTAWAAEPQYRQGDRGTEVVALQLRLNELGYAGFRADGYYDSRTVEAVKRFQRARRIRPDGVVNSATYKQLMGKELPGTRTKPAAPVAPAAPATPTPAFAAGKSIIDTAKQYVGVPYKFGGTTPKGFDCSGYIQYVFALHGKKVPRTADDQYRIGIPVDKKQLRPGDLVFFSTYAPGASHSGIYVGEGKFISATTSRGVQVTALNEGYWSSKYIGARRP